MKLLIAAKPSLKLLDSFAQLRESRTDIAKSSWIDNNKLHLSLYAIGEVPNESSSNIQNLLRLLLSKHGSPFLLEFHEYRLHPSPRKANMLWARFHYNATYHNLQLAVRKQFQLMEIGKPESQIQQAHITLCRFTASVAPISLYPISVRPKQLFVDKLLLLAQNGLQTGYESEILAEIPL